MMVAGLKAGQVHLLKRDETGQVSLVAQRAGHHRVDGGRDLPDVHGD